MSMINTLQAGRFVAAMAVVFLHAEKNIRVFVGDTPDIIQNIVKYGYLGVDFFFVISGFIIHYTMRVAPRPADEFAYGRFTRIMTPYWPIGMSMALAYSLFPALSGIDREWGWLSTSTLFPTTLPPALHVAWTLQHELIFYFLYASLFYMGRIYLGLCIWGACIVLGWVIGLPDVPLLNVMFAPINIEFIAGIVAAEVFLRDIRIRKSGALLASAALIILFAVLGGHRTESWLVGFAIAALLPSTCQAERAGRYAIPAWLVWGGAASYAIYLIHPPLLSLSVRILGKLGIGWPSALVLCALASILGGGAYYIWWERPIMRRIRRPRARAVAVHENRG